MNTLTFVLIGFIIVALIILIVLRSVSAFSSTPTAGMTDGSIGAGVNGSITNTQTGPETKSTDNTNVLDKNNTMTSDSKTTTTNTNNVSTTGTVTTQERTSRVESYEPTPPGYHRYQSNLCNPQQDELPITFPDPNEGLEPVKVDPMFDEMKYGSMPCDQSFRLNLCQ